MQAYFERADGERRARPTDDMMSVLLEAELGGAAALGQEVGGFFNLLATAGNETVTKLLASAFYWLDALPDQRRVLVERSVGAPRDAVEEFLRFDPPSHYQGRTLTRDVSSTA